jgi:REP element-mobilizing transposase RayT
VGVKSACGARLQRSPKGGVRAGFFDDADYLRYRADLRELALREACAVHAYVLMTNHVHLLMTLASRGAVARLMQSLGRRYVRYVNDRYHRTGTLWEGRYKACLVDDGDYLLHCHRYIELIRYARRWCLIRRTIAVEPPVPRLR